MQKNQASCKHCVSYPSMRTARPGINKKRLTNQKRPHHLVWILSRKQPTEASQFDFRGQIQLPFSGSVAANQTNRPSCLRKNPSLNQDLHHNINIKEVRKITSTKPHKRITRPNQPTNLSQFPPSTPHPTHSQTPTPHSHSPFLPPPTTTTIVASQPTRHHPLPNSRKPTLTKRDSRLGLRIRTDRRSRRGRRHNET